ncbi:MAG TPA: substrate-binding domain-containing protein [Bacteroidia bacterium]|nr:substrate-binding domain-containing protein [Bacteroidia bacterium]
MMEKINKQVAFLFSSSILFIAVSLLFVSCGQAGKAHTDTPTSGVTTIGSDDSYTPTVNAEIQVFQALYKAAAIHVKYEPEDSLFKGLMKDSLQVIVAGRKLTTQEETYFKDKQLFPEQVKIATDAIAILVNNDNPDTMLTMDKIKAIFNGDSTWDSPGKGKITVVFDHENSGNSRYIRENLMKGSKFPTYCFALNSNPQVIDYVSKNKGALGIIGVNWVSNDYDSATVGFLNKAKVVYVSLTNGGQHFQPYQYYIKTGDYPLCRDVYMIKTEPYMGLGSGFLSFVTSDKGQRIIFHEGILPATVPTHIISF